MDTRLPAMRRRSLVVVVVMLSASLLLASCVQIGSSSHSSSSSSSSASSTTGSDAVTTWLRQHAIRLTTAEPGGADTDLQPLASLVGNASIVGLGEETHGTHEFITMKTWLVEFLVTRMGFTTFVMENNWGTSRLVDAYINGGTEPIADVMRNALFTSWQTQEYRDLLIWMRAYNLDPAHTTKLHFYGMDIQNISQSDFDAVESYVRAVAPDQLAQVQQVYAGIIANSLSNIIANSLSNAYATYPRLSARTQEQYQQQAQQVYDLLYTHQQAYASRSSPYAFALALQNARIIAQFTTYMNTGAAPYQLANYIQRDVFMAENVSWIYDHIGEAPGASGSQPKLIVWAHDLHIANNPSYYPGVAPAGTENMGAFLRARYQSRYLPIATAFYQGSFTTFRGYQTTTVPAGAPDKQTYNYTLGQVGLSPYLVDLRAAPPGAVADWATGQLVFREFGLDAENLSVPGPLKQWFDLVVFIRDSTPSRPL